MFFKPKQFYKLHYRVYTLCGKIYTEYETLIVARSSSKAVAILEKKLKRKFKNHYGSRYQIIGVSDYK